MRILVILLLIAVCILPAGAQDSALSEVVAANADLSTLFTLLSTANLLETLRDPATEYTLLAPTNAAFEALPAEAAEALLSDPALLTEVLTYHLVEGNVASAEAAELPQMAGVTLLTADLPASNGLVHIIDRVLLPENVVVQLGIDMSGEAAFALFGTLNPAGLEN